jgi:hypothetical protein
VRAGRQDGPEDDDLPFTRADIILGPERKPVILRHGNPSNPSTSSFTTIGEAKKAAREFNKKGIQVHDMYKVLSIVNQVPKSKEINAVKVLFFGIAPS